MISIQPLNEAIYTVPGFAYISIFDSTTLSIFADILSFLRRSEFTMEGLCD